MCGGITQNMNKNTLSLESSLSDIELAREIAETKWLEWGAINGWPKIVLRKWDYVVETGEEAWRKYIAESSLNRIEDSLRLLEYENW